jgi:hypothetical protein
MSFGIKILAGVVLCCFLQRPFAQTVKQSTHKDSLQSDVIKRQLLAASDFFDAAINSVSALNSLIKKENYRNRISSFNNPASSDLGFNLEAQIQSALKPLLAKAKTVNQGKFNQVINSLINNQAAASLGGMAGSTSLFNSIVSLVGNVTITEKRLTKSDLDTFIFNAGKYFLQFEKLQLANATFNQNIQKLDLRLAELQMDIRENLIDLILIIDPAQQRQVLKAKHLEELLLKYFDRSVIETGIKRSSTVYYPGDGIKAAKDITATLEKIFLEYQSIYAGNYREIMNILAESRSLGKDINLKQVENSSREMEGLYNESKNADVMNLRINTLTERLRVLVNTEALKRR